MDERADRERAFHDERYADDPRVRLAPAYRAARAARDAYRDRVAAAGAGGDALEVGCGAGGAARVLGPVARSLIGIDVSPVALDAARAQVAARSAGWSARIDFMEMDAESLSFPDGTFDLVCGRGILHHVDAARLAAEAARVLRPGGRAVFLEPLGHNPFGNLFRRLTPRLRSEDEHPLLEADLESLHDAYAEVRVERYALLTPLAIPLLRWRAGLRLVAMLERADRWLFARSAWARRWAWIAVIEARTGGLPDGPAQHDGDHPARGASLTQGVAGGSGQVVGA